MRHPLIQPRQLRLHRRTAPRGHALYRGEDDAIAAEMLEDLERETVDFIDNYDGKGTEPRVLAEQVPQSARQRLRRHRGSAWPRDSAAQPGRGLQRHHQDPRRADVTIEEIIKILPGPDFPTGGIICGRQGIFDGYRTAGADHAAGPG